MAVQWKFKQTSGTGDVTRQEFTQLQEVVRDNQDELNNLTIEVSDNYQNTVKLNQPQQIFDSKGNQTRFLEWKNGNTRMGFVGKGSSSSNQFSVESLTGSLLLSGANGTIDTSNDRLINVATPTAANDATNKSYVDGKTPSAWITIKATTSGNIPMTEQTMTNPQWVDNAVYEYCLTIKSANDKFSTLMGQFLVVTSRNWTTTGVIMYEGLLDVQAPFWLKIVFGTSSTSNTKFKIAQETQITSQEWGLQIRKLG